MTACGADQDRSPRRVVHDQPLRKPGLDLVGPVVAGRGESNRAEAHGDVRGHRAEIELSWTRRAHQRMDVEHRRGLLVRVHAPSKRPQCVGDPPLPLATDDRPVAVTEDGRGDLAIPKRRRGVPEAQIDAEGVSVTFYGAAEVTEPAYAVPGKAIETDAGRPARVAPRTRTRIVRIRRLRSVRCGRRG